MTYYKFLNADGTPCHGGTGVWHLPKNGRPGRWMPVIRDLKPCVRGYHVCREQDLMEWTGPTCFEVEIRGEQIVCDEKVVAAQARLIRQLKWDDRTARLFACDCAERACQVAGVTDPRSLHFIAVARSFARGEATEDELSAARAEAWAAARAEAREAAREAAWAAARAEAWAAAREAALAARRAAAREAARAAAWEAAWAAERRWQTARLLEYLRGERS